MENSTSPFSLQGKNVLVTGASSGIGRAVAVECSKMGARCIVTGRNGGRLQDTLDMLIGDGHASFETDLTDEFQLQTLVEAIPVVDGLVSNAGVMRNKPLAYYKSEDLNFMFGTNLFAPMMLNRYLLKKKKLNKGASVVFTSSVSAFTTDLGNGIYGATKAGLSAYMRYCARELASKCIRCNAVMPGLTDTHMLHQGAVTEEEFRQEASRYPLQRIGRPEDIAWAVVYLLSDASAWVTGTSLVVDGGVHLV